MLAPVCCSPKICILYAWLFEMLLHRVHMCASSIGSSFTWVNAGTSLRGLLLPEGMTVEPSVWIGNLLAVRTAHRSHVDVGDSHIGLHHMLFYDSCAFQ